MTEQHFGSMGMDWNDYVKLFMNVKTETAIGEASVRYLWSKTVAAYIHAKIPHVQDSHGPERSGGSGILRISGSTCGWCAAMLVSQVRGIESCLGYESGKIFLWWPILETGLYYESVERYLDRFPRESIRILLYDNYRAEPSSVLAEIFRFLV